MDVADEVFWDHNKPNAMKAWRIMTSMVQKVGAENFEDVRPDVSCTKNLAEVTLVIGSVGNEK